MIGKVTGRVDYIGEDHVLIDTAGVGYIIYCSSTTLRGLPDAGEITALYTDLVVREDLLQLYGFPTLGEREWHKLLTSVQGVGAKVSLAILGTLGLNGLGRALASGDAVAVKAAPGVGPKLATRIVTELKGKAPTMMAMGARGAQSATVSDDAEALIERSPKAKPKPKASEPTADTIAMQASADALSALINLGYDRSDAAEAVSEASADGVTDEALEDAIRGIEKLGGLTPRGIRMHLGLNKPIYARTAAYGHFGRLPDADGGFSWERVDLVDELKASFA